LWLRWLQRRVLPECDRIQVLGQGIQSNERAPATVG